MREAEILISELSGLDRASLYLNKDMLLGKTNSRFLAYALKRRIRGEPLPYILEKTEFMGFEFKVNSDVLIPRQETELLVEAAADIVGRLESGTRSKKILDLGTGSGCIAVALAKLLKDVFIYATDISKNALKIAAYNARMNLVSDKIEFLESDLFSNDRIKKAGFDMIVTNPPYVARRDLIDLPQEVRHEPLAALDGSEDGLFFYRRIIKEAGAYLKEGGILIMEMGFNQCPNIQSLIAHSQCLEVLKIIKDYGNIDRVIIAQKK